VDYYDSSIDTSPTRTATTLRSLNRNLVIILGGKSKGLDYSSMLDALRDHATAAVLVGENKYEILSVIADALPCYIAEDFAEAADLGIKLARDVGALLLSPASASYDMFASYEARGRCFKKLVRKGITDEENLSRQQRDD
jgi:UDP-N-acetylmuramoylalanine--D-glutamate ligase